MDMSLVVCKCINCDVKLGTVVNLWIQIGKRWLALVINHEDQEALQISMAHATRLGETGTVVEGWYVALSRIISWNYD
jgi:hypothetical protein